MDTLCAILLYLNALAPGSYPVEQINLLQTEWQPQINIIESSPGETNWILSTWVYSQYHEDIENVVVVEWPTS